MTNIILKKNDLKKFITPRKKLVMKDERLKIEVRRPETEEDSDFRLWSYFPPKKIMTLIFLTPHPIPENG